MKELNYLEDLRAKNLGDKGTTRRFNAIENSLKALDLIVKKNVLVKMVLEEVIYADYWFALEDFYLKYARENDKEEWFEKYLLTEEEFYFLKEVLRDEIH